MPSNANCFGKWAAVSNEKLKRIYTHCSFAEISTNSRIELCVEKCHRNTPEKQCDVLHHIISSISTAMNARYIKTATNDNNQNLPSNNTSHRPSTKYVEHQNSWAISSCFLFLLVVFLYGARNEHMHTNTQHRIAIEVYRWSCDTSTHLSLVCLRCWFAITIMKAFNEKKS